MAFLTQLGYTIVERNWRAGATGEIDIVAMDGSTQVFVEVKTSTSGRFGPPEGWVTPNKCRRLTTLAQKFIAGYDGQYTMVRFDVMAVQWQHGRWLATHLKDAFDAI